MPGRRYILQTRNHAVDTKENQRGNSDYVQLRYDLFSQDGDCQHDDAKNDDGRFTVPVDVIQSQYLDKGFSRDLAVDAGPAYERRRQDKRNINWNGYLAGFWVGLTFEGVTPICMKAVISEKPMEDKEALRKLLTVTPDELNYFKKRDKFLLRNEE